MMLIVGLIAILILTAAAIIPASIGTALALPIPACSLWTTVTWTVARMASRCST
jgi:hypothetical protein